MLIITLSGVSQYIHQPSHGNVEQDAEMEAPDPIGGIHPNLLMLFRMQTFS